jgi:hypothetical protein
MRPCHGGITKYETDPHWRDLVLFHEYFHGETGRGCGASHQTGWTALAVKLLENTIEHPDRSKTIYRDSESEASEVRGATGEEREEMRRVQWLRFEIFNLELTIWLKG